MCTGLLPISVKIRKSILEIMTINTNSLNHQFNFCHQLRLTFLVLYVPPLKYRSRGQVPGSNYSTLPIYFFEMPVATLAA